MLQHLKYSLPDWILCVLAGTGLSMNVVQSFLLPEGLSRNGWMAALVCAVVAAILVLCSYNRVTMIVSSVVAGAGVIAVMVLGYFKVIPALTEAKDPEENTLIWYIVVAACAAVVYLLARTRITSWILLILGALAVAYFAILEYTVYLWAALLFLFAAGAWICFIGYRKNVLKYSSMRTAFVPMTLWAGGVALICLLVGSLVWWGVIRPIDPPTQDLTMLTDYLELQRLEALGLIDEDELFDWNTFSNWYQQQFNRMTNELEENPDYDQDLEAEGTAQEDESESLEEEEEPVTQQEGEMDWLNRNESGPSSVLLIILIILGVLVLAALVVLFLNRRRIWYRYKTRKMTDESYIRYFYPWYLVRLWRLRLPKPRGDTPMEYARRLEVPGRFLDETGVTWEEVSEIFSNLAYGGRKARPGDREKMDTFFKGFPRACRKKKRLAWVIYALMI
ncbi:MAG: DUF4129 domain-containing protein [Bacteroidales bacterium]|nr:DUF4129 domain-containing protein [Bacteroidales bacterium]